MTWLSFSLKSQLWRALRLHDSPHDEKEERGNSSDDAQGQAQEHGEIVVATSLKALNHTRHQAA